MLQPDRNRLSGERQGVKRDPDRLPPDVTGSKGLAEIQADSLLDPTYENRRTGRRSPFRCACFREPAK